jgi:hypothetical protein
MISAPSTVTETAFLEIKKLPVLISEFMGYAIETIHLVMLACRWDNLDKY